MPYIDVMSLNCRTCKRCNTKGKPSVMKGSAYCEDKRGVLSVTRKNIWDRIRNTQVYGSLHRIYKKSRGR